MALADYQLPQVQTIQDASIPSGVIQTPTTPAPVYATPDAASLFDSTIQAPSAAEVAANTRLDQYNQLLGIQTQAGQEQAQQFATLGGAESAAKLADIASQYQAADLQNQQQQQAFLAQTRGIGGYTQSAQTGGMEDINRANAVKKLGLAADAAILQGRVDTAKVLSEQAIKAKYGDVQGQIDSLKSWFDVNKDFLARADKKNYERQTFLLQQKQKEIDQKVAEETKNKNAIVDLVINASSQGAPSNIKDAASKASTPMEAAKILGQYAGDYWGTKYKIAQINKMNAEAQEIASKVTAAGGVGSTSQANSADQAKFLLNTIAEASNLSGASGRSAARRGAESFLVGATDYTNLESKVRTVKNNLLTLATDPNIKKFFGPQMTESDVKNMLAAASTLDTEGQTPKELKAELDRVQGIFQKFVPDYKAPTVVKQDAPTWASSVKKAILSPSQGGNYGYQDNTQ